MRIKHLRSSLQLRSWRLFIDAIYNIQVYRRLVYFPVFNHSRYPTTGAEKMAPTSAITWTDAPSHINIRRVRAGGARDQSRITNL